MTTPATTWRGAVLVLPGAQVLLGADAVAVLLALTRHYRDLSARVNGAAGIADSTQLALIVSALEAAHRGQDSMSAAGHPDMDTAPTRASSDPVIRADDLITCQEVATMLGIGERQARRLAAAEAFGTLERVGPSIVVHRADVLAYAAMRSPK